MALRLILISTVNVFSGKINNRQIAVAAFNSTVIRELLTTLAT